MITVLLYVLYYFRFYFKIVLYFLGVLISCLRFVLLIFRCNFLLILQRIWWVLERTWAC